MELRLGNLNVVILMGRVCMDPELKYLPSGAAVLNFRIAVDHRYKDKATDEWKSDPSFFNVQQWAAGAERSSKLLHKGSPVIVEGSLRSRSWEGKDGEKKYVVEVSAMRVQCLEKKQAEGESTPKEPDVPKEQLDDIPF